MNKQKTFLAVIISLCLGIGGYFFYQDLLYVKTDNAQVNAHALLLAPKVAGYVTEVMVEEGQTIKVDEVVMKIDDRDYINALEQKKAELASMEAKKNDAEKNAVRVQVLYNKEAISQQQYDQTIAILAELKSTYDALSAQKQQAELNLENTQIRAPYHGFVAKKSVEKGQFASPGVPVLGVVDAQERWIMANFKETQLEDIKIGKKVDIKVDALPSRSYHGIVHSIASATGATFTLLPPDNATGNFTKVVQRVPVKIKLLNLTNDDIRHLKAGLSAYVVVHKR